MHHSWQVAPISGLNLFKPSPGRNRLLSDFFYQNIISAAISYTFTHSLLLENRLKLDTIC